MIVSILHIVPSHVDIRPGQGSHKDVAARRAFFTATGAKYLYTNVAGDDPSQLDDILRRCTPSHVLIEYSYFPRIAKEMRRRLPDAYIAVRAHNIEPLQEWTLAEWNAPIDCLRNVYAFFRLLGCDARTARTVDHIFVISPIEARRYWRWLGIGAKVSWLPYISPPELRRASDDKERNVIACLPGGTRSRRTLDLVIRFARFAQVAKEAGWSERFVVTGDIADWGVQLPPAVEQAGYVADLPAFYRRVKAVAVLSPIGYGFKTTIADAIWSGATVLVHPTIGAALAEELRPCCVTLDALTISEMERMKQLLRASRPGVAVGEALMRRFDRGMAGFMRGFKDKYAGPVGRSPE